VLDGVLLIDVAVHREAVALASRAREDVPELRGRIALLVRVQPDPHDPLAVRQRLLEGFHGRFRGEVAEEAHDQLAPQPERLLGLLLRAVETVDHRSERDPARSVSLRIEEDLGVHHVLGVSLREVRHREVVEVALGEKDAHPLVVDGEEGGEIVEAVGGPHLVDGAVGKIETVACGQLELQLGLQGALEMQMELGLRHRLDECRQPAHIDTARAHSTSAESTA
jgi:hypothetical protein